VSVRVANPLPECENCERPTLRATWDANDGLCTDCAEQLTTVRMLPVGRAEPDAGRRRRLGLLRRDHEDPTVYVERYLPPVPGQLHLEDQQ
jgi:hypothetical protein